MLLEQSVVRAARTAMCADITLLVTPPTSTAPFLTVVFSSTHSRFQLEFVLEARASAAVDSEPQEFAVAGSRDATQLRHTRVSHAHR